MLIDQMEKIDISKTESLLSDNIFGRLSDIPLIDKYEAFQLLDNCWNEVSIDLEIIQTEGFSATKKVVLWLIGIIYNTEFAVFYICMHFYVEVRAIPLM